MFNSLLKISLYVYLKYWCVWERVYACVCVYIKMYYALRYSFQSDLMMEMGSVLARWWAQIVQKVGWKEKGQEPLL